MAWKYWPETGMVTEENYGITLFNIRDEGGSDNFSNIVQQIIREHNHPTEQTYNTIKKLIGEIYPIGKTEVDNSRFENLKLLISLIRQLISDIKDVGELSDCSEYSRNRAGKYAQKFLQEIITEYE